MVSGVADTNMRSNADGPLRSNVTKLTPERFHAGIDHSLISAANPSRAPTGHGRLLDDQHAHAVRDAILQELFAAKEIWPEGLGRVTE